MNNIKIIIGMMIVTFIPRYLPLLAFSRLNIPKPLKKLLRYIFPAALGALILPGAITAIPNYPAAAAAGIATAIVCSWFREEISLTVFLSVIVTLISLYLFGY
ncbi:MAG TPA: AzlD domain-containing protein [Candidatus Atribacteria bacterium]|jgi:branched-subunit amino acid transport protein|nr:AzlD domain-containing protein [Atribacterota bacterium]HOA99322.1 AzlD domain-containing protein [Candidatus Atribacteria bacterium]MDI9608145.1 AzlD domain-containing protein [Atribacterota bacterium]HOQ51387.1 AzlD domain-containing protein [Candidatus Atribacteria bacterium]HPT64155.1 AzlD domain-containing protein [Candidatus Atribacteria bacterium]